MTAGIASHLRERLFDKPSLLRRQDDFALLDSEMFPGRSHFIAFLEERHFEAQIEEAKHILLRLAYQAEFPPPNKFLTNLLETESHLAGATLHGGFIGQDHFVHLVNLYLLGLYVFWYHGAIHKRVVDQFQALAGNIDPGSRREARVSACRRYIASWREFVLFHDLGYPWEVGQGWGGAHKYLDPFAKIEQYATKDGALFAISQLIALEWIKKEETTTRLENDLKMSSRGSDQNQVPLFRTGEQEANRNWGSAERLPATTDAALWRLICEFVPPSDRLSILETTLDGLPVASTNDELRSFLVEPRPPISELTNPQELAKWAARNDLPTRLRGLYQWSHYTKNFEQHYEKLLKELFPSPTDGPQAFRQFVEKFLDKSAPPRPVAEDLSFDDYAYEIFFILLRLLDFVDSFDRAQTSPLAISHNIAQSAKKGLQIGLLKEVGRSLEVLLEKHAGDLDKGDDPANITTRPLEQYLKELLEKLKETKDLEKEVGRRLSRQLTDNVDFKNRLFKFYSQLKMQITNSVEEPLPAVFPHFDSPTDISSIPEIDRNLFERNHFVRDLDRICAARGLTGSETLFRYVPVWARQRFKLGAVFPDHGLVSGLLYAQVVQFWQSAFRDRKRAVVRLLRLRGRRQQVLEPAAGAHSAEHEVLYTIFIHNLYPSSFESTEHQAFRTKRDKNVAFTYLALLCDSLQPWDRKRLFNQGTGPLSYVTNAENFNVEIDGNVLRITERGDQLRIDERQAALRTHLDSYLERASELVKLHLSEWRQ